ncbi:MAG: Helix-turn-helix, AraC domain protein [Gemmatimonadetes bacterium]|nr:Helix-turn-helix, AraC domain protein [Gemmatimonadota bacterium]
MSVGSTATAATNDIRTTRHRSERCAWESVSRDPDAQLRAYVHGAYQGWTETAADGLRRREVPVTRIPLILNLGPDFVVSPLDAAGRTGAERRVGSFVAGLGDACTLVGATGPSRCIQVDLTLAGARRVLGVPMDELANRVVEVEDVLGPAGRRLVQRLGDAAGWADRFRLLDAFIARRVERAPPLPTVAARAWRRLEAGAGRVDVAALAADAGCSRKHLAQQFREHLGLPPKTLARILRFNRAVDLLRSGGAARWTEIALACGYYDQAHLNRDFRQFAGTTPGAFIAHLLPDGGGVAAD